MGGVRDRPRDRDLLSLLAARVPAAAVQHRVRHLPRRCKQENFARLRQERLSGINQDDMQAAYSACDSGFSLCSIDSCGFKSDKAGKWANKKCAKKVGKCSKKKKIRKRCKRTCCFAGY